MDKFTYPYTPEQKHSFYACF